MSPLNMSDNPAYIRLDVIIGVLVLLLAKVTHIVLAGLVLTLTLVDGFSGESCSEEAAFVPCACQRIKTSFDVFINLRCEDDNITSIYRVLDYVSKSKMKIFDFYISSKLVANIRDGLFLDTPVTQVNLDLPNVKNLPSSLFKGQKFTLERIEFLSTNMDFIPLDILKPMDKVIYFSFKNSKGVMTVIGDGFQNILSRRTLSQLDYSHNNIHTLGKRAFSDLTHLFSINLSKNKLATFDVSILPPKVSRTFHLNLEDNEFTEFPSQLMNELPQHSEVQLTSNKIANISEDDLKMMIRKEMPMYFQNNPLNCNCSFVAVPIATSSGLSGDWMHGTCQEPESLRGVQLSQLKNDNFINC